MNHLDRLESQSLFVIREAFNKIDRLALLWSAGKDSQTGNKPGTVGLPLPGIAVKIVDPATMEPLAANTEGLVLVAGSRFSGKQMLTLALVDLVNRARQGYIITLEEEVSAVLASGRSVISQREVRWSEDEVLAAIHSALRENPSVLVLDEIRTGAVMNAASQPFPNAITLKSSPISCSVSSFCAFAVVARSAP